jgi:hypothetical protein
MESLKHMLMTRWLYISLTVFLVGLNIAALWALTGDTPEVNQLVPAALIINAISWPLALAIAYRVGQVTGVEYLRRRRAKSAALRASRSGQ